MINFECPHCGNPIKVPAQAAGRKGTCKACGKQMLVPNGSVAPPAEAAVQQNSDEASSISWGTSRKKSPVKAVIAIAFCLLLLLNTPFAVVPMLVVSLFCVVVLVFTGVVETPKQSLERQMQEANEEAIEIARYRELSEEGKLLYDLQQKQEDTQRYLRGIFWFLMVGALGGIIVWLLNAIGAASR